MLLLVYYAGPESAPERFRQAVEECGLAAEIRQEKGCLRYDYFLIPEGGVLLVEHWESASLQQTHLAGTAMERLKQLKERFGVVTARVERYEETGD